MKRRNVYAVTALLLSSVATASFAATPRAIQTKREALRVAIAAALAEPTFVGEIVVAGFIASILAEIQCDPTQCVFDPHYTEPAMPRVVDTVREVTREEVESFFGVPVDGKTVELVNHALRGQLAVAGVEWAALTTAFRHYSAGAVGDRAAVHMQQAHLQSLIEVQVPQLVSDTNSAWRAVLGHLKAQGVQGPVVTQVQARLLRDNPGAVHFSDTARSLMRAYGMTDEQIEEQRNALLESVPELREPVTFEALVTQIMGINEDFALKECACVPPAKGGVVPPYRCPGPAGGLGVYERTWD